MCQEASFNLIAPQLLAIELLHALKCLGNPLPLACHGGSCIAKSMTSEEQKCSFHLHQMGVTLFSTSRHEQNTCTSYQQCFKIADMKGVQGSKKLKDIPPLSKTSFMCMVCIIKVTYSNYSNNDIDEQTIHLSLCSSKAPPGVHRVP